MKLKCKTYLYQTVQGTLLGTYPDLVQYNFCCLRGRIKEDQERGSHVKCFVTEGLTPLPCKEEIMEHHKVLKLRPDAFYCFSYPVRISQGPNRL